jgi:hypothetical protein
VLAYAAITTVTHKDVRYAMSLLVFLAVLGSAWIVRLLRAPRRVAIAALVLAVAASTMGATFGVGHAYSGMLPGNWSFPRGQGVMPLDRFTIYSNHNYMVSGPRRSGDLPGLFRELRRAGIREVGIYGAQAPAWDVVYNLNGLRLFVRIAHLTFPHEVGHREFDTRVATLIHLRAFGRARPCVPLPDGQGVWIRLGDPPAPHAQDFCPRFHTRFYGP